MGAGANVVLERNQDDMIFRSRVGTRAKSRGIYVCLKLASENDFLSHNPPVNMGVW